MIKNNQKEIKVDQIVHQDLEVDQNQKEIKRIKKIDIKKDMIVIVVLNLIEEVQKEIKKIVKILNQINKI
jgi:hypothetical protein